MLKHFASSILGFCFLLAAAQAQSSAPLLGIKKAGYDDDRCIIAAVYQNASDPTYSSNIYAGVLNCISFDKGTAKWYLEAKSRQVGTPVPPSNPTAQNQLKNLRAIGHVYARVVKGRCIERALSQESCGALLKGPSAS